MIAYALDSDLNLVTTGIPYKSLEWVRRYYEAGQFLIELPISLYDPTWSYIGVVGRKELGIIQQDTDIYGSQNSFTLGGFFYEKKLDDKVCYPRYIGDVQHTEQAVRNIFTRYKGNLNIKLGKPNDPLLGDRTQSDFSDDYMGDKLYRILESRECSYSVDYDVITKELTLNVWQGKDRTQSQRKNAWQTFSSEFGNIADVTHLRDVSDYKNYAIIPVNGDDNNREQATYYLDLSNGEERHEIVIDMRDQHPEEGQSLSEFKDGILQQAAEKMNDHQKIEDVDLSPIEKDAYMVDFDLGDKCTVFIKNFGLEMEARIVEIVESMSANGHRITLGFGNKRISRLRRALAL